MSTKEKPSIVELLKLVDEQPGSDVNSKAKNYLAYFDASKDTDEATTERKSNMPEVVNGYYDLATDFYEYGWGESFHFAVLYPGEPREQSILKYEYGLALKLRLSPGELVLDVGCGVGGPARHIASFSEARVVGLNCNEYQLKRARSLTEKSNLQHLVSFVKGDFHRIPYGDGFFNKVYSIEATCHSPELSRVYGEIFRVLKAGGLYACCEWVLTDKYDHNDAYHRRLKQDILEGNGLPDLVPIPEVLRAARDVGFEIFESRDRSTDTPLPWYSVLEPRWTLADLKMTSTGRWLTHGALMALETIGLAPKGSVDVHRMLCKGADALAAAGKEGIFSPLYLLVLRKPTE